MENITFKKLVDNYVAVYLIVVKDIKNIEAIKIENGEIIDIFKCKNLQKDMTRFLQFIDNLPLIDNNNVLENELKTELITPHDLENIVRIEPDFQIENKIIDKYINENSTCGEFSLYCEIDTYETAKNFIRNKNLNIANQIIKYNESLTQENLNGIKKFGLIHKANFKDITEYVVINLNYVTRGRLAERAQDEYENNDIDIFGISALKVQNGKIKEIFHKLLKLNKSISEIMQEKSGITNQMLKSQPTFEQVKNEFFSFINNQVVVSDYYYHCSLMARLKDFGAEIKEIVCNDIIIQEKFKDKIFTSVDELAEVLDLKSNAILNKLKYFDLLDRCLFTMETFEKLKTL